MERLHITFIVAECYGHIVPTLGIAMELLRRGHHVSYFVPRDFHDGIEKTGAEVLDSRFTAKFDQRCDELQAYQGHEIAEVTQKLWKEFLEERSQFFRSRFRDVYGRNRPSLIVYDLCVREAKSFAELEGIPRIEHSPLAIDHCGRKNAWGEPYDEKSVMVSMPGIFQRGADILDERFHFTGFCHDGREVFFNKWTGRRSDEVTILVAGQSDGSIHFRYFDVIVRALSDFPGRVILSLAFTDISSLGPLPKNFEINPCCSNFSILRHCDLFIGQGGQGSTQEALYWGVPVILIPPDGIDYTFIGRVTDLGLGFRLEPSEASPETVRQLALVLLASDSVIRRRVQAVSERMHAENGSERGANFVEALLASVQPSGPK